MGDTVSAQERYYTARKFLLSLVVIVGATVLLWVGKIPPQFWADVVVYSLAVFGLADVGQRAVDAWSKR
jgi:hypothetical protein